MSCAKRNEVRELNHYDAITLTGIRGHGHHGVFETERFEGQEFIVDVTVYVDTRDAAGSDDLAHTVHYGELAEQIHEIITGPAVDLIETLAQKIANLALSFSPARAVDVTVHKPSAPITVPFDDVAVKIHRTADEAALASPREPEPLPEPELLPDPEPLPEPQPEQLVAPAPPPPPELLGAAAAPPALATASEIDPEPAGDIFDQRPDAPASVILALGANLGEAQETLVKAIRDISAIAEVELVDVSPLARTAPVGPEQPDFYNCVVRILTMLTPRELLGAVHEIENAHGRERHEHWGPRTLDIDIITFGNLVGMSDDLELPHPRAHERAFVLVPWAELEPNGVLPGLGGGPIATLATSAPDRAGIRWMSLDWLT